MLKTCKLTKNYNSGLIFRKERRVFKDLDLKFDAGRTYGLMGPSGSGKSTFARVLAGLEPAGSGGVLYKDVLISDMDRTQHRDFRRNVQVMFQDPVSSFNPSKKIGRSMEDVLGHIGMDDCKKSSTIARMLGRIGLPERLLQRYPSQLSGGENQRLALARIFLLEPEFVILDEPTSALDVSVQAKMLHLLKQFQADDGVGYLFISHDERVARFMSDEVYYLNDGSMTLL